jgi:hypothetical protein
MKYYRETKDGVLTGLIATDGTPGNGDYAYEEIGESAYLTQREEMLAAAEEWDAPPSAEELLNIFLGVDENG